MSRDLTDRRSAGDEVGARAALVTRQLVGQVFRSHLDQALVRPVAAGQGVEVLVDVVLAAHAALLTRNLKSPPTPPASASSAGSSMNVTRASVWRPLATSSSATSAPLRPSRAFSRAGSLVISSSCTWPLASAARVA